MSIKLPIFEELVASEAAIRGQSIIDKPGNKKHGFIEADSRVFHCTENMDAGDSRKAVEDALFDNYLKIYDYQFQDSSQHKKEDAQGKLYNARHLTGAQSDAIKQIFIDFVNENYDENGNLTLGHERAPQELAKLYERFQQPDVALKHATMALGVLLVELSHSKKWVEATTPNGIDFTRGDATDDIVERMKLAIDGKYEKPPTSAYIHPPGADHVVNIAGVDFPCKKLKGDTYERTHLVTENGYLVDLTHELHEQIKAYIESGKPLCELQIDVPHDATHLAQYMDSKYFAATPPGAAPSKESGEEVRKALAKNLRRLMLADSVDGHPVETGGEGTRKLPLFSISPDLMTGLLMKSRPGEKDSELSIFKAAVTEYSNEHGKSIGNIIDLIPADAKEHFHELSLGDQDAERRRVRLAIKNKVMEIAAYIGEKDEERGRIVERAADKLSETLEKVYESADKAFIGKEGRKQPAAGHPHVYISQGGTGSGKGGLKKLARDECGDSLVVASLDDMRADSDRLWLYPALEIHHEDYKSIGDFSNAVRDLTVRRAEQGGYNLFVDGSGIPYENRNDKVVKGFKDKGYHVSVLGAQAPLSIHSGDHPEPGKLYDVVTMRGGARLQDELRAVPMRVIAEKHHGHPIAAHDAARDQNIDRFMIVDTSPAYKESYTLSYVVDIPAQLFNNGLGKLEDKLGADERPLHDALAANGLIPDWVKWPKKNEFPDELLAKKAAEKTGTPPVFDHSITRSDLKVIGVKPGATHDQDVYRVEIIVNLPQYVNMVQKGLYNAAAEGPEALFDNRIKCDIDGVFKNHEEKGRLRLQPALGVEEAKWPVYVPPLANEVRTDKRNMGKPQGANVVW